MGKTSKTIEEALEYTSTQLKQALADRNMLSLIMADSMLDKIILNLKAGKSVTDPIDIAGEAKIPQ